MLAGAAAQVAWRWAASGLASAPDTWTAGEVIEGPFSLRTVVADDGARELHRTVVLRPDEWDPSLLWRTTVDIVQRGEVVDVGVCVEQDMRHHRIPPSPLQPPLVSLLQELVGRGARAGGQRVAFVPQAVVGPGGVEDFVNKVLIDRERRLPVLLFTNLKEQDGSYPEDAGDPSLAARELCGLAHVYVIPRTEDTHRLTRRLGMLSAYDGAVRIYWPRFHLGDPPPRHPLHLRQRLNKASGPAIVRRIIEAGARSYRPPDGTAALLAVHARERERQRVEQEVAALQDDTARATVLRDSLYRALDENVRLEQEIEALRDQLQHAMQRAEELETRATALRGRPEEAEVSLDLAGEAVAKPAVAPETTP
ncbi:MAG: hypothetical protein E6J45_05200 [Chloroflexi bacterium]|nr:MAG: hypothetical protein E6J45_05200 [Chloroflexota bacterium]